MRCICHARMEGECMCGAWDEPIATRAPDRRDTRIAELEAALEEALDGWQWTLDYYVPISITGPAVARIAALRLLGKLPPS